MSGPGLSAKEQEHLAVLRVSALAADPAEVNMSARRADVLVLLAVVDRFSRLSRVGSLTVVRASVIPTALFADSVTVYQQFSGLGGTGDE
jgi:hypothetical protein